jgi:acetylornithine deacetylase/succinyl-diaminopimelate desuccinylase-like protein
MAMSLRPRAKIRIIGRLILIIAWPIAGRQSSGVAPQAVREKVRAYRAGHEVSILRDFADFLAIPNVASDGENIRRNAERIISMLGQRGIRGEMLQVENSPPSVCGELLTPSATRTAIFYAHFDGQPVDPSQWASDPWKPMLRDKPLDQGGREVPWSSVQSPVPPQWRVYARSASDDKAPVLAVLAAIDALRANNIPLSINLKFFFEGEEEAGSDHLPAILQKLVSVRRFLLIWPSRLNSAAQPETDGRPRAI